MSRSLGGSLGRALGQAALGQLLRAAPGPLLGDGQGADILRDRDPPRILAEMHSRRVLAHSSSYALVAITPEITISLFNQPASSQYFLLLIPRFAAWPCPLFQLCFDLGQKFSRARFSGDAKHLCDITKTMLGSYCVEILYIRGNPVNFVGNSFSVIVGKFPAISLSCQACFPLPIF